MFLRGKIQTSKTIMSIGFVFPEFPFPTLSGMKKVFTRINSELDQILDVSSATKARMNLLEAWIKVHMVDVDLAPHVIGVKIPGERI